MGIRRKGLFGWVSWGKLMNLLTMVKIDQKMQQKKTRRFSSLNSSPFSSSSHPNYSSFQLPHDMTFLSSTQCYLISIILHEQHLDQSTDQDITTEIITTTTTNPQNLFTHRHHLTNNTTPTQETFSTMTTQSS